MNDVELRELRIFLALADELHFGRTAELLGLSQPAVSDAIRFLERRLGTRLFDRTSRRVALTTAGVDFRERLMPVFDDLGRVLGETYIMTNGVSGIIRVATTYTTLLPPVFRMGRAFQARHPRCAVDYGSAKMHDPFTCLRRGQADVLVNWLAVDEPDLTVGPVVAYYDRVLVVGVGHRLAKRSSVSVEELGNEAVGRPPSTFPATMADALLPPRTPSGRAIRRVEIGDGSEEGWFSSVVVAVASGEVVHPTMRGVTATEHQGLVIVPIHDLPLMPLGLIWRTATEDARIHALVEVARSEGPWPASDLENRSPEAVKGRATS
ncbi:MAG: LysR family transcriptional regulator [Acidimicrobiales bacterium]